jgi:hypothetical protein
MNQLTLYLSFAVLVAAAASVAMLRSAPGDTLVLTSPKMVHAGSQVEVPITLKTSSRNLSALEWQVSLPPGVVFEATTSLQGKILQCFKQLCILYGGQSPITTGVVGRLTVHLPGSPGTDVPIALHNVLAATSDGGSRKVGEANLKITLQP